MNNVIAIYHGSTRKVTAPLPHYGKGNNDYGQGFYCTRDKGMAGEWACQKRGDGFINAYMFDMQDLKILHLNDKRHNVLNWIATLVRYRTPDRITDYGAYDFLLENYSIDTSRYDVIEGLRADDSYFTFARDFINNAISVQTLEKAIHLGKLGKQIVMKSDKASSRLKFQDSAYANKDIYYPLFMKRDADARSTYYDLRTKANVRELYVIDILRDPSAFTRYLKSKHERESEYDKDR